MTSWVSQTGAAPVVVVGYEGPGPQRRLTIAFRVVLALPHYLYAVLVGFVGFFAVVAGWFAALVLGRLPGGIADFLARVVQYVARVNAYGYLLLTDRFPSFELGRTDEAVSVDLPRDVRLNRAAVLFRGVLLIPVGIVVQLLSSGLYVVVFVGWLLALMLGRLPVPLFEALAAVLRYEVRYYAYAGMLTSEYPRGLFGDGPPETPTSSGVPSTGVPGIEEIDVTMTGSTSDVVLGLPVKPRITTLVLSRAAKWIIGLILALGVVLGIVANVVAIASTDTDTVDRLEESYLAFGQEAQRYSRETQGCAVSGGLECLHEANRELADAVRAFRAELRALDFTTGAIDEAEQLDRAATALVGVLERMTTTTDPAAYEGLLVEFQSLAVEFDEHFNALHGAALFS